MAICHPIGRALSRGPVSDEAVILLAIPYQAWFILDPDIPYAVGNVREFQECLLEYRAPAKQAHLHKEGHSHLQPLQLL